MVSQFRGHVFVVDDDGSFLAAVCRLIRAGGFKATGVTCAGDLIALCPLPEQSCVLSDIILDGESGLELPAILLNHCETAPVVFMSATDDPGTLLAADHEGAVPCLRKPFEAQDLFNSIEVALSGSRQAPVSPSEPDEEMQ